jgi:DNA modification methylase
MNAEISAVLAGDSEGCIVCGDCLDVMADMPDGCVDAVVTDPPYGLNFRDMTWDGLIPPWLKPARRLAGLVVFPTAPLTLWEYPKPTWVCNWYRPASSSRSLLGGGFNHWSPILVYGECKFPTDSINLHAIANAYPPGFPHPSPKPTALMEWIVGCLSAQVIIDPFAGSGTTCVAAKRLGRRWIGIDISERYCEIASNRIRNTERPLFGGTQ